MPNRIRLLAALGLAASVACGPKRTTSTTVPATIVFVNESADLA